MEHDKLKVRFIWKNKYTIHLGKHCERKSCKGDEPYKILKHAITPQSLTDHQWHINKQNNGIKSQVQEWAQVYMEL